MNFIKNIEKDVKNLNFFLQFSGISFSPSLFFTRQNIKCYCENTSTRKCHFVISTFKEHQKAQVVLIFFNVASHFSPKIQCLSFSSRFQSEAPYINKKLLLENHWASSLCYNHDNLVMGQRCHYFIKKKIKFQSCHVSITTGLIASTEASIKSFQFLANDFFQEFSICFPASKPA